MAARNVIAASGMDGVVIAGVNTLQTTLSGGSTRHIGEIAPQRTAMVLEATGNVVLGNYIGLNAAGTAPFGNSRAGVMIYNASGNSVAVNVIAANHRGVHIVADSGKPAANNRGQGNLIGADPTGTNTGIDGEWGNYWGVLIEDAGNNMIGERNTLSGNYGSVGIIGGLATGNLVQGNYIGVDLNGAPLANGPSNKRGVYIDGGQLSLDLYTYPVCDTAFWPGYGEGRTWLLTQDVRTTLHGNAAFSVTLPSAPPAGYAAAGTLTDPQGNTSEFSNAPYILRATPGLGAEFCSTPSWIPCKARRWQRVCRGGWWKSP